MLPCGSPRPPSTPSARPGGLPGWLWQPGIRTRCAPSSAADPWEQGWKSPQCSLGTCCSLYPSPSAPEGELGAAQPRLLAGTGGTGRLWRGPSPGIGPGPAPKGAPSLEERVLAPSAAGPHPSSFLQCRCSGASAGNQVGIPHLPARRHRGQEGASTPGLTRTEAEQDESSQGSSELCQHRKKSQ